MKKIYTIIAVLFGILLAFPTANHAASMDTEIVTKSIKSDIELFKRDVRIEIQRYDFAKIDRVSLKHVRETVDGTENDFLIVKGAIKHVKQMDLSNITVGGRFLDENGKLIESSSGRMTPDILRLPLSNKGAFTMKVPYSDSITEMQLGFV